MKFLVCEGSKPLANNVAQGSIQDVLSLYICTRCTNLDYKVFCKVIASFNCPVKL